MAMKRWPACLSRGVTNNHTDTRNNRPYDMQLTQVECDGSTFTKTTRLDDFNRERPAVDLVSAALSVSVRSRRHGDVS